MITGEEMVQLFWGEQPEGGQDDIDAMEAVRTAIIKDVLNKLYDSRGGREGTPDEIYVHLVETYL